MPRAQNTSVPPVDVDAIAAHVIPIVMTGIAVYIGFKMMYRAMRSTIALVFWVLKWSLVALVALWIYSLWNSNQSVESSLAPLLSSGTSLAALGLSMLQRTGGLIPLLEQLQTSSKRRRRSKKSRKDLDAALEESLAEFSESIGLDKYLDELVGKKRKRSFF